jgi:transcription elongation factor GreB
MSKAFTKEEGGPEETVRRPPSGHARYITPEGHQALVAELAVRQEERRALADLAEGMDIATQRAELDARIGYLQATLEAVEVVTPDPSQRDRAFLGAYVTLEDEEGEETRYRLVGPDEADAREGRVSVDSPLGRALLGRSLDDEVQVERPRGRATFTVIGLDYPSADDAHPQP